MDQTNFFKGCRNGKVLLGPFLNTLSQIKVPILDFNVKIKRINKSAYTKNQKDNTRGIAQDFLSGVNRNGIFVLILPDRILVLSYKYPANIYLFTVNNRNTRKSCEICLKLTRKTPEPRQ